MKIPPLNATRGYTVCPHLSPDEWLYCNPPVATLGTGQKLALYRRNGIPPVPGFSKVWSVPVDKNLTPDERLTLLHT